MPRYARFLALLLSTLAPAAYAQVTVIGSVQPSAPGGFTLGAADTNLDGVDDFIQTTGNTIDTSLIDTNPTGGFGLRWNEREVWRNYDSAQNILIGDAGSSGSLTVSGADLRYQNLILGAVSERADMMSELNFDLGDDRFTVPLYLNRTLDTGGGYGVMRLTGFDSTFNNDPNLIPSDLQLALGLGATGAPPNDQIVDLVAATQITGVTFPGLSGPEWTRDPSSPEGYDVVVGLDGGGSLVVEAGATMQIQDALMIGVAAQSSGDVIVDGAGSSLFAFGRTELLQNGTELRSIEATSFVGGRGTGTLTVSNGARAEFRNGLSIGAPTGLVETALGSGDNGDGSGVVIVTGAGATMTAFEPVAAVGVVGDVALAIGAIRTDNLSDSFDPGDADNANLQPGSLTIADGAVVSTAVTGVAGTADAAIGKRGELILRDGRLQVGDNLANDGEISGYGRVTARTMEVSRFSVIRGGDPQAENPQLAEPLRIVLLDEDGSPGNGVSLENQGLIEGRIDLESSGAIVNEGQIEASGEIFTEGLYTSVESVIRSQAGSQSPLRIRLNSTVAADDSAGLVGTTGRNERGALHNRGLLAGNLDIIAEGGVINGDNRLTAGQGTSVGGAITASGRVLAGSFLNNVDSEVRVAEGESLSILTNAATESTFTGAGLPNSVDYRTLNFGSISVDGGDLEIGYQADSGAPFPLSTGVDLNTDVVFFNARSVVDLGGGAVDRSVGTITVNDGTLRLPTGVINAGVMAFTGGDNLVNGEVLNTSIDYVGGGALVEAGAIVVSGNGTTVTFEDFVRNTGVISIGPFDNVVNFLGGFDGTGGALNFSFDALTFARDSAVIVVDGTASFFGGALVASLTAPPEALTTDVSIALLVADDLSEESLFTDLVLPDLAEGKYWDIVFDTELDEVRLEIVMSDALGADFTGDGIVTQDDVDVWIRNAGIQSGASVIQGDADLDGDVDLADYDVLMAQLFTGIPEIVGGALGNLTVPEPTTALLLGVAALGGLARRR